MKRRGIFLISVLLMGVLIAMFVGAAIALAPASLMRANLESRLLAADRGARSGLAWSLSRLRNDPAWRASLATSIQEPMLRVQEQQGQVVGWTREDTTWTRFRVRFNWQDGPASPATDGLDNPSQNWPDFPFISANNLASTSPKPIPEANGPGGSVTGSSPVRLQLPAGSALLCIEGASGPVELNALGHPVGFSAIPQTRITQVVVRLNGTGQAVTPAALMGAGDVAVNLPNLATSRLNLKASPTQATRLRSKGTLKVEQGGSPNVASSLGDLRANSVSNVTTNGVTGSVTSSAEDSGDGFYAIAASEVKTPSGPMTPAAGVYVVNSAGILTYYDMNYSDYTAAKAAGTLTGGTAVSIPGMTVSSSGTSPKVRLNIGQDVLVSATSNASDFVIIPDGGAPTTNNTYDHSEATSHVQNYFTAVSGWLSPTGWQSAFSGWSNIVPNLPGVVSAGPGWSWTAPNGATANLQPDASSYTGWRWTRSSGWNSASAMDMAGAVASTFAPGSPNFSQALADYNYLADQAGRPQYTPVAVLPPAGALTPKDLQVNFEAPSGGSLVVKNAGDLIFGSQIRGNGAALVSESDIQLIGTSSDLSSTPGESVGLNLYAQGNILINSFKLDSAGTAAFHGVNLEGVVYSWGNVIIQVGDSSIPTSDWGNVNIKGAVVAYGGDPGLAVPSYVGASSSGRIRISGAQVEVEFDPAYLTGLYQNVPSPAPLQVTAWHQH